MRSSSLFTLLLFLLSLAACRNSASDSPTAAADKQQAGAPAKPAAPEKMILHVEPNGVVHLGARKVRTEQLETFLIDSLQQLKRSGAGIPDSIIVVAAEQTPRSTKLIIQSIVETAKAAALQH